MKTEPFAPAVAVIGCKGRMGTLFTARLGNAGCRVRGVDLAPAKGVLPPALDRDECAAAISGADAVLLCIPVNAFAEVLALLGPLLSARQLLMDTASVKLEPLRLMEAAHLGPCVGTHPLFGPEPEGAPPVALVAGNNSAPEHMLFARRLFEAAGFTAFETTADEHDLAAAHVQCLNFVTSAAFFAAVPNSGTIRPFLTPSFLRRLSEQKKLLTEDAPMFEIFTAANPRMAEALKNFRTAFEQAASDGLHETVRRAALWYEDE